MRFGLGIDAGGTYTDTVLFDFHRETVVSKGKALTTKDDYARGIAASLDQIRLEQPDAIELVGLSTTLATNALVEGKGARAGLLLIGYDPELTRRLLPVGPYVIVSGGHDMRGQEKAPLKEPEVCRALEKLAGESDVIAISQMGGAVNPEHEQRALAIARRELSLPAIAGHEISTEMDSMKRAVTVFWNARLIPILLELIEAVSQVLKKRGVNAPIMLVRSDGTLMGEELARQRPIETLMSGPVASVYGALRLTGCKDAVVVDMGGTTTDVGVIRNGQPRLETGGARIGKYRTTVKTLDLQTSGLGGDSEIKIIQNGTLAIGPQRVVPVSYAASQCPAIARELREWESIQQEHVDSNLISPVEFYLRTQRPHPAGTKTPATGESTATSSPALGEREAVMLAALEQLKGASRFTLARAIGYPYPSLLHLEELESRGWVERVGLTPTDVLHALGKLNLWDHKAAMAAVEAFARRLQRDVADVLEEILDLIHQRLTGQVINALLAETFHTNGQGKKHAGMRLSGNNTTWIRRLQESVVEDCPIVQYLLATALHGDNGHSLTCQMSVKLPLIAVGAPVASYFPAVAKGLHTRLIIPEHADVANAVGAITGNIAVNVAVTVRPTSAGIYIVEGMPGGSNFSDLESARTAAVAYVEARARQQARAAGAEEVQVEVIQDDRTYKLDDEDNNQPLFLEAHIRARAVGRPRTRV